MILVALAGDGVRCNAVVREVADGTLVCATAQLVDVIAEHLPYALDVVEDADFLPDPLDNPDGESIGVGSRSAKVEKCSEGKQWIGGDAADAAFSLCSIEDRREVSTLESPRIVAFPDVLVTLWIALLVELPLGLKHVSEPFIVTPVGLDDNSALWLFAAEELVDGV